MVSVHFGQLPPQLFTRINEPGIPEGAVWQDPDDEWVPGRIKETVPDAELQRILNQTEGGALYLLPLVGARTIWQLGGLRAYKQTMGEIGGFRLFKELVKRAFRDPYQEYWPIAVNGYWAHRHDATHVEVSKLKPIRMGKVRNVNGIDGHSYRVVPLFHPDNPEYKAKYNGLLDEYRVAIHVYCLQPSPFNLLRLMHYVTRFIKLVPDPWNAIKEHKASMRKAGMTPRI